MMEWIQALTVIASLTAVIGIVANLLNKRIDDLRQDMDRRFSEMDRRLDRMEQDASRRFSEIDKRLDRMEQDVDRRFNEMDRRFDRMEQDIREIRQLLYKVFEVPQREDK